ncbi:MAG: serine/threonine protein kinase [Sulfolobaceae archaeon]|nr:serine/threonine protein kinase [Sulfolobaceae archaeon]
MQEIITKILNAIYSQSEVIVDESKKYVIKRYLTNSSIKWYLLTPFFMFNYPYVADPFKRMSREIDFLTYNWKDKIRVPKLIDYDTSDLWIIREYIEGRFPENPKDFRLLGRTLKNIHNENFCLGDTKYENFVISGQEVYVIDAEQAIRSDNKKFRSWDLLVLFLFTSYKFVTNINDYRLSIINFLEEYEADREVLEGILDRENGLLLSVFLPTSLIELKNIISEFLK